MATTKKKNTLNPDLLGDYCGSCSYLKQIGDTARLAQMKKINPAAYAEWEKRQPRLEKALQSRKK